MEITDYPRAHNIKRFFFQPRSVQTTRIFREHSSTGNRAPLPHKEYFRPYIALFLRPIERARVLVRTYISQAPFHPFLRSHFTQHYFLYEYICAKNTHVMYGSFTH